MYFSINALQLLQQLFAEHRRHETQTQKMLPIEAVTQ